MSSMTYSNQVLDKINTRYPGAGVYKIIIYTARPGTTKWLLLVSFNDGFDYQEEIDGDTDSHKVVNAERVIKAIVKKKAQKPQPASAYHE